MKRDVSVFPIRHPNLWKLQWRDEPPRCLALKTNEAYVQEAERAVWNGDISFKGPIPFLLRVPHPKDQNKSSSLKVPGLYV